MDTSLTIKKSFGDFQTPEKLALDASFRLYSDGLRPKSIIEPNCGKGTFLVACHKVFSSIEHVIGLDINPEYVEQCRAIISAWNTRNQMQCADLFGTDLQKLINKSPEPILIIGNPPWVTNAGQTILKSSNVPKKTNTHGYSGMDAMTGHSNFDISETMIMRCVDAMIGRQATLAMICKTHVAGKILLRIWSNSQYRHVSAKLYSINARRYFDVSASAGLLVLTTTARPAIPECDCFDDLQSVKSSSRIGLRGERLVSDLKQYDRLSFLMGDSRKQWRSGVKHDCSKVMEFREIDGHLINGLGEVVDIEDTYVFPLFKSSDVANAANKKQRRILVTQTRMNEDTQVIRTLAPKTWEYLLKHMERLRQRASRVYKNRPEFSMFGVGPYTFSPYKIAISGFYKHPHFKLLIPINGKPPIVDDTCYFIACNNEADAQSLFAIINSNTVKQFYSSLIFKDEKRPITIALLRCLDIEAAAHLPFPR